MKDITTKYKRTVFIALSAVFVIAVALLAIPDLSMGQLPPGLPDDPEQTPIDGGLGILAALGGTYAIKKLREKE